MISKPKNRSTDKLTAIYVGNLAFSRTENDIKNLFSKYGKVHSVKIIVDPKNSKIKKGYAFVFMPDSSQANKAISALNLKQVDRRTLKVSLANPKAGGITVEKKKEEPQKKVRVVKAKRTSGLDKLLTFLNSKK